jgi:hypothetical protein
MFPYGKSCGNYDIRVTTPPIYAPHANYQLSSYSYQTGRVRTSTRRADSQGRLQIQTTGGRGEEIGISGENLSPPVLFLTDTLHENIYVEAGKTVTLSFEVINLSTDPLDSVVFSCSTERPGSIQITSGPKTYDLEPGKVTHLQDLVTLTGHFTSRNQNLAYLHLGFQHKGARSARKRIIQVHIMDTLHEVAAENVKVFDGRSESLQIYRYGWGDWHNRVRMETITEGRGNGNGVVEPGEIFSVWIRLPEGGGDPVDRDTWHPVVPVGGQGSLQIPVEDVKEHLWTCGRALHSAQMTLPAGRAGAKTRTLHVQSELTRMLPADDCHRGSVDRIYIRYFRLPLRTR